MPVKPQDIIDRLKAMAAAHGLDHLPPGVVEHGTSGDDSLTAGDHTRLIFGLGGNDTLAGGSESDAIFGGSGADRLGGGGGNDLLLGGEGNDTLSGGTGGDTLAGGPGGDVMTGGPGADAFLVGGPHAGLDRIFDFTHGEDRLVFGPHQVATAADFATATAADLASAKAAADARIAAGTIEFVAVKVGADVIVFADVNHDHKAADAAVMLVGRTLTDIGFADIH
ncbi:MAG: hypothetical protein ACJ798_04150 [Phenylobacterium sp.]